MMEGGILREFIINTMETAILRVSQLESNISRNILANGAPTTISLSTHHSLPPPFPHDESTNSGRHGQEWRIPNEAKTTRMDGGASGGIDGWINTVNQKDVLF